MKTVKYLLITITFLFSNISYIQAQNNAGKEFWLTFGQLGGYIIEEHLNFMTMEIRIVNNNHKTTGNIYFTSLGTSIDFEIEANTIYSYILDLTEKLSVYNTTIGSSYRSIHITSSESVVVYAMNALPPFGDATNVLPVTVLGTEYYHISNTPVPSHNGDAYGVIAIEDGTEVFHNNLPVATLTTGEVYYHRCTTCDMTGDFISSNKPIAYFVLSCSIKVSNIFSYNNIIFQQLAPVNTWGKLFFAPLITTPFTVINTDFVRIVASQNHTTITQTGDGIILPVSGGQTTLTNLMAGQFVELAIPLSSDGCFFEADKPIGVSSYKTPANDCVGMSWLPPIEQTVTTALVAPFIPKASNYVAHYAQLFTSTITKESIKVSVGGAQPAPLSGGEWIDNLETEMSFYNMPLSNDTAAYYFTGLGGGIILCYGISLADIYHYPAGFAMRDLQAAFYANNIPCGELKNNPICEKEVNFRAEIENIGVEVDSIKWLIDGVEYLPAQNQETWDYTFTQVGEYEITMEVYYFENGETKTKTIIGTLKRKNLWVKMRNVKH